MDPAFQTLGSPIAPLSTPLLERFMHIFEAVFHPLWFAVASVVVLAVYEWRLNDEVRRPSRWPASLATSRIRGCYGGRSGQSSGKSRLPRRSSPQQIHR